MAHLITNHDPYHIHKIVGLLVLLHYVYRFYLIATIGTAFPTYEPRTWQLCGVLLHGLLSWSSLLLPLPKTRNFSKPMIWPEFRFHSIIFATRHVITTTLSLANLWPNHQQSMVANALIRAAVILGTVKAASYITDKYGNRTNRTTNTMPYPESVTIEQQTLIKRLYTSAQFGATITSLMNDPTMNFAPLLGIQMAPLLMTLVRKGKVNTGTYHRVYSVCLSLGYVAIFVRMLESAENFMPVADMMRALILFSLPFKRSRQYVSAQVFWSVTIALATIVHPLVVSAGGDSVLEQYVSVDILKRMIMFSLVRTMACQTITYAPLFTGRTMKKVTHVVSSWFVV